MIITILLDILLHLIGPLVFLGRVASSPFPSKVVACINFIRNLAYIDVNFLGLTCHLKAMTTLHMVQK
jgi:hypothetical protein